MNLRSRPTVLPFDTHSSPRPRDRHVEQATLHLVDLLQFVHVTGRREAVEEGLLLPSLAGRDLGELDGRLDRFDLAEDGRNPATRCGGPASGVDRVGQPGAFTQTVELVMPENP